MNGQDKKDLELILYRLDEMEKDMKDAHLKNRADLKFIKENLFNPDSGLWAETKKNTAFREGINKSLWIFIPASIATMIKVAWDSLFKS